MGFGFHGDAGGEGGEEAFLGASEVGGGGFLAAENGFERICPIEFRGRVFRLSRGRVL